MITLCTVPMSDKVKLYTHVSPVGAHKVTISFFSCQENHSIVKVPLHSRSQSQLYQTLPKAKHTMRYLFALLCLAAAVYAAPNVDPELSFPTVGEIFGPLVFSSSPKYAGRLTQEGNQLLWTIDINSLNIHLKTPISPDQMFRDAKEMETHVRNSLTEDTAVIKVDPYKLNGRYLEVLWSKVVAPRALKMICHYSREEHFLCHTPEQIKLTYSMVRLVGDHNTVFPITFLSHKACPTGSQCYWISHPVELAVVDKSII